ncbi:MAG: type VI secretion system baseplate subunit TssK [Lentisphaerales bacterium]|nr:type VI secretion system baseplate subunit TssK [Lentisphaerales bacterium]
MIEKLPRVHWQLGQPLLPDHFVTQEEALLADAEYRFRLGGLPHHGVAEMEWRTSLLDDEVLSLSKLTIKTPSGLLLAIPGNAKLASPLNLQAVGSTRVQVYCHVTKINEVGSDMQESTNANEKDLVSRSIYELHLSSEAGFQGSFESIKIAEFTKNVETSWELSESFVPPLLMIGQSPFLQKPLKELAMQLDVFRERLINETASTISAENMLAAKACLQRVFGMQRLLLNLNNQINLHPYIVYERFLEFYASVCTYQNSPPEMVSKAIYQHDDLAEIFNKVISQLLGEMKSGKSRVPYLPFEYTNGRYTCDLPQEVREATSIYLLIQKKHIQSKFNISNVKLSSPSRSPLVHKLALPGVPFKSISQLPFQHSFGSEVDFYEVNLGEEWDYVLKELSVVFYLPTETEEMTPYIYWRLG